MRAALIRIGNSRGLRIPKALIEQSGFSDAVDLRVRGGCLVVAPDRPLREGWAEAFQSAAQAGAHELLLDGAPANEFDRGKWKW
jgi:antitoxin MazE